MDKHVHGSAAELDGLLGGFASAILTTRGEDGFFHSRPMAMQKGAHSGELWFVTELDTDKVHEIEANPECSVTLHGGGPAYVSISGHAEVIQDRRKIRDLWSPAWRAWFPDGPEQHDIALVRVQPDCAEWVNPKGGRLKVLVSAARRMVTHERPQDVKKDLGPLH